MPFFQCSHLVKWCPSVHQQSLLALPSKARVWLLLIASTTSTPTPRGMNCHHVPLHCWNGLLNGLASFSVTLWSAVCTESAVCTAATVILPQRSHHFHVHIPPNSFSSNWGYNSKSIPFPNVSGPKLFLWLISYQSTLVLSALATLASTCSSNT